ncbi:putative ribosomal protein l28e protein [Phaeoacremonium minimum UCRPA7]|uniref:Putative ribosomal protein l28e protein n=1 Tax=Phaeoacremonium minimum (strain UCR-PA7) TaxID=1286976 RepID=R8BU35_PHAM7|nr:putative ribosomal protein l28e protein [Phaeoacremonium minimum UCRPA7]EOO02866.1 putative ribosomal protein l28e protein [Phaeoacremonium minimum UCRPA7]
MGLPNVSADLVWEIVRSQNAYLVKSKTAGKVQFSRDPLNLTNKHSRKYAGFVNDKAIGITGGEKGGVQVVSKKAGSANAPAKGSHKVTFGGAKSSRKIYKSVANQTAKSGYRGDLREAAVARASAIRRSQRPVKPEPETKLRGSKAKKAADKE